MTKQEAKEFIVQSIKDDVDVAEIADAIMALDQEPCEDAISRQAVPDCLTVTNLKKFDFILDARDKIKNLPPVTPQPKTGHWTHDGSHWKNRFICSECGYKLFDEQTNFCPDCGARMEDKG